MQFSAAIAMHTSCDKYSLEFGNFLHASASYSEDAQDTATSQEQLTLLVLPMTALLRLHANIFHQIIDTEVQNRSQCSTKKKKKKKNH